MKNKILFLMIALFLFSASAAYALNDVNVYFFYSTTCPHCKAEKAFLEEMQEKYENLNVEYYVVDTEENIAKFQKFADTYGASTQWVPATFICDEYIVGFDSTDKMGVELEEKILNCMNYGCTDLYNGEKINETQCEPDDKESIANIPIFGKIDLKEVGLPAFTLILGFLDGFNPCAMWVLCFLLTLLLYAKSRKKIILIGSIFVVASGAVYFLFMAAWLNFFLIVGFVNTLVKVIAIVAILAGLINMKDFLFFKKGISLTIPDGWKPKLFEKMRKLVKEEATLAVVIGTIVLAFTANSFELICTFGFPAIYTRALTLQGLSNLVYYSYLALYNLVYIIPLAVIVTIFAATMGAHKFGEKQGKILKLISGLLMLALGLLLLFRPELMMFG